MSKNNNKLENKSVREHNFFIRDEAPMYNSD